MEIQVGKKVYTDYSNSSGQFSRKSTETQEKSDNATTQSTLVSISQESLDKLQQDKVQKRVDAFIAEKGKTIYELAIKRLKTYPENLASKLDSDSDLSTEARSKIANKLNQRELETFGKYAQQSPPDMKMYFEKYIEYLDSLSPEEQQSERYRGQRAAVLPFYERASREQGEQARDLSFTQDSVLTLFQVLEKMDFTV